jgi:DNA-binding NarL/FixJ family response regulator
MRVLLADDHPLFIEGLKSLLTARGWEVTGTARDGLEALELARQLHPDVILMDIEMPRLDGIAATRLIKAEFPAVHIVMLTMSSDKAHLFEAIKSGASGYLLKTQPTEEFFQQLMQISQGDAPLSPGMAMQIVKEFERQGNGGATTMGMALTARQVEVLTLVSAGFTYKEVGAKLFLSERTVKYHMGEILQRLHLKTRAEVLEYTRRQGYKP